MLGLGGLVVVAAAAIDLVGTGSPVDALKALVAAAIAVSIAAYTATLPGVTVRGLLTGGFFVAAGIVTWYNHGYLVWLVLAVEGVVFLVWSRRWRPYLPAIARNGAAWLGLAYWLLGIIGAALALHPKVAAQRLAYAGVFTLAALAVVANLRRRKDRDLTVGIAASFLYAIAALVLAGAGNLFDATHPVPSGPWGIGMQHRFWGASWLLDHPNALALIAVAAAIRIGPDRAFTAWQRLAATAIAGFIVYATNSRTGFVFFGAAAVVHAGLLWLRKGSGLPSYRRPWLAMAAPVTVLGLVLLFSGGQGFLFQARYGSDDMTSGRLETWKAVGTEWMHAGWVERVFGDTRTARAVVVRGATGTVAGDQARQPTDNAAVGALRRGGVLGVAAFLLGLGLMLWHALRGLVFGAGTRPPPAFFTIAAVSALPTIVTSDWLLGGTGGTFWILLVAAEALTLSSEPPGAPADPGPDREPSGAAREAPATPAGT
jgi:hypothetical protein